MFSIVSRQSHTNSKKAILLQYNEFVVLHKTILFNFNTYYFGFFRFCNGFGLTVSDNLPQKFDIIPFI